MRTSTIESRALARRRRLGRRVVVHILKSQSRLEAMMRVRLMRAFDDLGEHVWSASRKFGLPPGTGLREAAGDDVDADGHKWVANVLSAARLDDWAEENLRPVFVDQWIAVARRTVNVINSELRVGVRLTDRLAGRLIATGGTRKGLVDLAGDTRVALLRSIAIAREEQLGALEIARLIRAQVPAGRFVHAGARYRSRLIARSESLHASRLSSFEVYRDSETVTGLLAHDALLGPDASDPECIERDGKEFTYEEAEQVMMDTHPQCTLNWSPVVNL